MSASLFDAFALHGLELKNRIVMAPMTRGRAENPELIPNALMARYYAQRAGAGLIVTEGAWVNREGIGFINAPGIFDQAQVEGWKVVTGAVHAAGGRIFSQLAHVGAVSHPDHLEGLTPLAPSAINPRDVTFTASGLRDTPTPREMSVEDIERTIDDFRRAALNAKAAGFDGVEIHGAHIFLIPEFLSSTLNQRTDDYGGSPENRARFVLELVQVLIGVWGPGRVGLKLSPASTSGLLAPNADTEPTFRYLLEQLNDYDLAYVHALGPQAPVDGTPAAPFADIAAYVRPLYKGVLIVGGGYTQQSGQAVLARGHADLIAYGAPFLANPDLVERFRQGVALATADAEFFYAGGDRGYADYPSHTLASDAVAVLA
uniref:NADH:flavin oxidoreductase/NADH oxidase n=1 Tax=Caulobacter sp. (strain K31) TaxID=366602 RepID=B0T957_CAUSK